MDQPYEFNRRNFIKKTALTAGAVTFLARGVSLGDEASAIATPTATATTTASGSASATPEWSKRYWECKRVMATRSGNNPFSNEDLEEIHDNYFPNPSNPTANPFPVPPGGPPSSGGYVSGPHVIAYASANNNLGVFSNWRDPEPPEISTKYDSATNQTWAVYLYRYYEERSNYDAPEP